MRPSCASIRNAVALIALALLSACGDPELVEDKAKLLTEEEGSRLSEHHGLLRADYDIDYRIVTVAGVGDINSYSLARFESLDVGRLSDTGRGLLLVVDAKGDVVRLEVSQSLEGVYPDGFIAYVEARQMVPFFRAGRAADGILATTELIIARAQRAQANAGFEGEAWFGAAGGGAAVPAQLGAGADRTLRQGADEAPGTSPAETLAAYMRAMDARNANPDLTLYTPATRTMLQAWVMTPAQMDNVVKTYRACHAEPSRTDTTGQRAVIRYPPDERACSPWFFEKVDGAWALDLTMLQRAVRFGRSNAWRFDQSVDHPYAFAFQDWRFDANGFPAGKR